MAKELKSVEQLAAIIAQRLNFGGVFIKVMKDGVDGWRAVAMGPLAIAVAVQAEVENIVTELRVYYDLID